MSFKKKCFAVFRKQLFHFRINLDFGDVKKEKEMDKVSFDSTVETQRTAYVDVDETLLM